MSSPGPILGVANSNTDELRAMDVLIAHQRANLRLLGFTSGLMFLLGGILFAFLYANGTITQLGPALGNLLTFISGLFPVSGVITANNRIGELEAAKVLAAKLVITANEQELLRELLKK